MQNTVSVEAQLHGKAPNPLVSRCWNMDKKLNKCVRLHCARTTSEAKAKKIYTRKRIGWSRQEILREHQMGKRTCIAW